MRVTAFETNFVLWVREYFVEALLGFVVHVFQKSEYIYELVSSI